MKEPLYSQAIRQGWKFTWNNKSVWIFGLFAAFLGQMGMVEFLSKIGLMTSDVSKYFGTMGMVGSKLTGAGFQMLVVFNNKPLVLFLLLLLLGLALVFVYVAVISQGAIIHSSVQSIKDKKDNVDITKAWRIGTANFWRIFSLNLIKKIFIIILAVIVSMAAYGAIAAPSLGNSVLFLVVFILASLIGLLMSFLVIYAAAYVIVEKRSIIDAIAMSWELFWGHWLVSIEVGLIVLIFNLVLGLLAFFGLLVLVIPTLLAYLLALVISSQFLLSAGLIVSMLLFTVYLMLLGAAFSVFTTYIWTHLFMKMHTDGIASKVIHYLSYKKKK